MQLKAKECDEAAQAAEHYDLHRAAGCGELHVKTCLKDKFAHSEFTVPAPVVSYRETCGEALPESGEHDTAGCGELHVNICLKDLRSKDAQSGFTVPAPAVGYRETLGEVLPECL